MKKLLEMRLFLYSFCLVLSSSIERIITNLINKTFNLLDNTIILYHFFSIVLLIVFFIITNIAIKALVNTKFVSKRVFGNKYVGGHWIEIVFSDEDNRISHYCDLDIGYDIDKIYLSGTDYDKNYTFKYNLETESASMENYCLSYMYTCIDGRESWQGYGNIAFHKKNSSPPDRYTGRYKGDDNIRYRVEGFLISDKKELIELNTNFIPAFDTIIKKKLDFLHEIKQAVEVERVEVGTLQ